ncbi:MAG TPA: hypothetical protein VK790_09450 [Solirubrobacteraceae bacterium]|nr:hypothetical protein [Solirubrobacteraceae bacterium]
MPALEVLAVVVALPEAMLALRELWSRRCGPGRTVRPSTELELTVHLKVRRH